MKKFFRYIIYTALLISTLLIQPLSRDINIMAVVLEVVAIAYLITKLIKKEKLNTQRIDYLVIVLGISSILPIIFKTNVSMQNSVKYLIKYSTMVSIYFVVKQLSSEDKKISKGINNVILISSVILLVIGIDKMTTGYFDKFIGKFIFVEKTNLTDIRMESSFMYTNTFAAFMGFTFIISLGSYLMAENKKRKAIYGAFECLTLIGIILSSSRILILTLAIIMIIYLILNRNKFKEIIITVGINGIIAMCYSALFMKLIIRNNFLLIWLGLAITIFMAIIINTNSDKVVKIKNRYFIAIIVSITIFCAVGILWKDELVLFKSSSADKDVVKQIGKVEGNKTYNFRIELEANTNRDNNYSIIIQEKNKYFETIKETSVEIKKDETVKELELEMAESTTELFMKFSCNDLVDGEYLKINKLYIDGKEEVLNYKYLPADVVNKFLKIDFNTKSVWERFNFYEDATKEFQNHWLIGIGGGAWEYIHPYIRTSFYQVTEVHSYPVQLLLENGLIGFLAYSAIILILIYKFLRCKDKTLEVNSIFCAILLVVVHSIFDFNFSHFFFMIVFFVYVAILNNKITKIDNEVYNTHVITAVLLVILAFSIYMNIGKISAKYVIKPHIAKVSGINNKITLQYKSIRYNPSSIDYKVRLIQQLQIYKKYVAKKQDEKDELSIETIEVIESLYQDEKLFDDLIILEILKNNSIELIRNGKSEGEKGLDLLYNKFRNMENSYKYDNKKEVEKNRIIADTAIELKAIDSESANKFYSLVEKQIAVSIRRFDDYEACRSTKEDAKYIQSQLSKIKESIKNGE